ncbi:translation initiation factor IF-1 [Patescibacteria group bacterium]
MSKETDQSVTGFVTEALPNITFRVKLDGNDNEILAHLSGKMRRYRIKVLVGDKVILHMSPDGEKGRIERRL